MSIGSVDEAEIADLANDLHDLGLDSVTERLRYLTDALDPTRNPSNWAGVDVFQMLDPKGVGSRIRDRALGSSFLGWLELARNVLVLAPILLTWLGLMYAVIAYRHAIAKNDSLLNRPFLLLWEERFHGELNGWLAEFSWLTVSHVAIADVAVIGIVVMLTAWIHRDRNVLQSRREQLATEIEDRLTRVGLHATMTIATRSSPNVIAEQFKFASDTLIATLEAHRSEIVKLAQFRHAELADLESFAADLKTGTADLRHSVDAMTAELRSLIDVGATLDTRLIELGDIDQGLRTAFDQAATDINMLASASQIGASSASNVAHSIDVLRAEVHEFRTQAIDQQLAFQEAVRIAAELGSSLKDSVSYADGVAKRLNDMSASIATVPSQLSSAAEALDRAAATISQSIPTRELATAASAQQSAASEIGLAATNLASPLAGLHEAAHMQRVAAQALESAATGMRSTENGSSGSGGTQTHRKPSGGLFRRGRR